MKKERDMMARQQGPQDEKRQIQKRLVFLTVVVLPLIVGAILWIASIAGLIHGPWSSLFAAIFTAVGAVSTVVGVVIAFPQWNRPSPGELSSRPTSPPVRRGRMPAVSIADVNLGANRRKGALIVKVGREYSGATVNLRHGFEQDDSCTDVASNVVLRMVDGAPTFVAIFPALEPDNYTVSIRAAGLQANVTILASQVAEIDWRYKRTSRRRFGQWLQINLRFF